MEFWTACQHLSTNVIEYLRSSEFLQLLKPKDKESKKVTLVPFSPQNKRLFKKRTVYFRIKDDEMHKYHILLMGETEAEVRGVPVKITVRQPQKADVLPLTEYDCVTNEEEKLMDGGEKLEDKVVEEKLMDVGEKVVEEKLMDVEEKLEDKVVEEKLMDVGETLEDRVVKEKKEDDKVEKVASADAMVQTEESREEAWSHLDENAKPSLFLSEIQKMLVNFRSDIIAAVQQGRHKEENQEKVAAGPSQPEVADTQETPATTMPKAVWAKIMAKNTSDNKKITELAGMLVGGEDKLSTYVLDKKKAEGNLQHFAGENSEEIVRIFNEYSLDKSKGCDDGVPVVKVTVTGINKKLKNILYKKREESKDTEKKNPEKKNPENKKSPKDQDEKQEDQQSSTNNLLTENVKDSK